MEHEEYNEEYKEEINHLASIGVENISVNSTHGVTTLAEILRDYALWYDEEHDQGEMGRYY